MQDRETALKEPCPHCGRTDYRWTHEFRVGLSFSPEDKLEIRCDYCRPLRMNAYYFEFAETGVEAIDRILSAVAQAGKGYHHTESWGDDGLDDMGEFHGGSYVAWIQNAANDAAKALASPLSAPPQEPTGASPRTDVTCEHGTAMDVHCCNCHSGFIFDVNHECPAPELTWREAVEQALGVENDPENHTPSWAFDVVRAAREIGNAPTPASPQAETPIQTLCKNCMQSERFIAPDGSTICHYCGFVQPAPVSPVEPTPPTLECCACGHLNTPQQATRLEGEWRSSGEYVCLDSDACARRIAECSEPPVEPTPEPETCEWRIGTHHLAKAPCFDSPWFGRHAVATWNGCPYCLKPLRLVPSEETPR